MTLAALFLIALVVNVLATGWLIYRQNTQNQVLRTLNERMQAKSPVPEIIDTLNKIRMAVASEIATKKTP